MENMAAMLSEVAGGLQQSFGSVFERVGQSLEQSAQMMQMMNGMMEAALLQNLVVTYTVQASSSNETSGLLQYDVSITVENRSQIVLTEVVVGLHLGGDEAASGGSERTERALEQGLDANSSVQVVLPLPQSLVGHEGAIRLNVRSPGTQQWISKEVLFRIPVLKTATIQAVPLPLSLATSSVQAHSDQVAIAALRDALRVSAFDPLLTSTAGHFRVSVAAGILGAGDVVFQLTIDQTTESPTGARVRVAVESMSEQEETASPQHWCRVFIEELESL